MEAGPRVKEPRPEADNFTLGEQDSRSSPMELCKKENLGLRCRAQTFNRDTLENTSGGAAMSQRRTRTDHYEGAHGVIRSAERLKLDQKKPT